MSKTFGELKDGDTVYMMDMQYDVHKGTYYDRLLDFGFYKVINNYPNDKFVVVSEVKDCKSVIYADRDVLIEQIKDTIQYNAIQIEKLIDVQNKLTELKFTL